MQYKETKQFQGVELISSDGIDSFLVDTDELFWLANKSLKRFDIKQLRKLKKRVNELLKEVKENGK